MPYLSGTLPAAPEPLARYLPPITRGCISAWLQQNVPHGAWVIDPFGSSPALALEAAQCGYRVLVAAGNPISRFLLEMAANPPALQDLQAALAELAASRKENERLEMHLLSLYETPCQQCRQPVSAEAFIWDFKSGKIIGRKYTCPHCGDSGERLPDPLDEERAARFTSAETMHRARALERIAPRNDPDRIHAEEALAIYLPRAVYALGTVINRLDQLNLSAARRRALTALTLSACDLASSLWAHPAERPRPRQLLTPPRFREANVWRAFEDGLTQWAAAPMQAQGEKTSIPFEIFPHIPPETGGICLFEGALRDLVPKMQNISPSACIAAVPRPNQAFWTLSALWAGWLWGREAVQPFKMGLRRRRYDWQWHAEALTAALTNLAKTLPETALAFFSIPEPEPPFVSAVLIACQQAQLFPNGVAYRSNADPLQLTLCKTQSAGEPGNLSLAAALEAYLRERAEPATYLHVHIAGTVFLAAQNKLPTGETAVNETAEIIQSALRGAAFTHFDVRNTPESGTRGINRPDPAILPLVDRVEIEAVKYLQAHPGCSVEEIQENINHVFGGLLTPPLGLLSAVMDSYAIDDNGWRLKPQDSPSARKMDLKQATDLIQKIGIRLNLTTSHPDQNLVLWLEDGHIILAFYILASAVIGKILHTNPYAPEKTFLVLPGGRAGLLAYKLRRDPILRHKAKDWRFLKFRHLRQIAETPLLTREGFEQIAAADPIEQSEAQMMMF